MFRRSPNSALWLSALGKLAAKKVSPGATSERDNRKQQQKVMIKSDNRVWLQHVTIEGIQTGCANNRHCPRSIKVLWRGSAYDLPLA